MKLRAAIDEYVQQRRAAGSPFVSSAATLNAFSRFCGDIDLCQVSADRMAMFMDRPGRSQITKISVFSGVKCFIMHYANLGRIAPCAMTAPVYPENRRFPRIFTRRQVLQLLEGTAAYQAREVQLDPASFRLALLLLYATGATTSEVLALRRSDIDIKGARIRFCSGESRRQLPVSVVLAKRLARSTAKLGSDDLIVSTRSGLPVARKYLCSCFRKLTRFVGLEADVNGQPPRLQDFRYTFAVHRLETWIRTETNLNILLPALSSYMGYADLLKAEEFLILIPERFRSDLDKLSPTLSAFKWRDDATLIEFLSQL